MTRIQIAPDIAGEILFASDRICCVCREAGKSVQLHHIDEDPANSVLENLAVLCLECHQKTQLRGGFVRHLEAVQVTRFRDDWVDRVQKRRDEADRLATEVMAGATRPPISGARPPASVREAAVSSRANGASENSAQQDIDTWDYVRTLPELKRRAYAGARFEWDSGVTGRMVEASYRVLDVYRDILANLAARYPSGHFESTNPREYISDLIATHFQWQRYRHQPGGHDQNGTIVQPLIVASVTVDAERMIAEMVQSLTLDWSSSTDYDFRDWRDEWQRSDREVPRIDVEVSDGKSVLVTATNKGRPFTLVLRGKLIEANLAIDHGYPYEYVPRKVGEGDVIKNYTIAQMQDHREVFVLGEGMALMQVWRPTWRERLEFKAKLTFLAKEEFTRTIDEYILTVALETGSDRLKADLRRTSN